MIVIFTGLPGAGKSLKLADTVINVLYRNQKIYKKTGIKRMLWTNLKMSKEVEEHFDGFIQYWTDLGQLTALRDVDVVIDEIATYFDARQWENLSLEMHRWLSQHRKFGIEIYGTSQDFAQVDKAFRRLTSNLLYLRKIIGSRDISATKPNPRLVWGFVLVLELDPTKYDEKISKFQGAGIFPRFMFITRDRTNVFDTRAEVKMSTALRKKHIEHICERPNCQFKRIAHV